MASMATETKSPTWTSTSPLSFLNSSTGTYASDLRPALTTTKLCSMRTTSAVMTSPWRMSVRCSDSSNRSAKDSDIQYFLARHAGFREAPLPGVSMAGDGVLQLGAAVKLNNPRQAGCALHANESGTGTVGPWLLH